MRKFIISALHALTSRRSAGVLVAMVATSLTLVGSTAQAEPQSGKVSAQATDRNGVCEVGEACLFYNSNCQGSFIDFSGWVDDFAGYTFVSDGAGKGQRVKNNAASARNRDSRLDGPDLVQLGLPRAATTTSPRRRTARTCRTPTTKTPH